MKMAYLGDGLKRQSNPVRMVLAAVAMLFMPMVAMAQQPDAPPALPMEEPTAAAPAEAVAETVVPHRLPRLVHQRLSGGTRYAGQVDGHLHFDAKTLRNLADAHGGVDPGVGGFLAKGHPLSQPSTVDARDRKSTRLNSSHT